MTKDKLAKQGDITISTLLHNIYDNWREGLTGLLSLERKDVALTLGHLVQRARNGNRLQSIMETWDKLVESGRIKEGYEDSDQNYSLLQELLNALDDDLLDENKFDLLRKIYFVSVTEIVKDRNDVLPYQFMRIARTLNSGEILLLFDNYNICKNRDEWKKGSTSQPVSSWIALVTEISALNLEGLILLHEQGLIDKYLLKERIERGSHVGIDKETYRLTDLGFALCEYIEQYDTLLEDILDEEG